MGVELMLHVQKMGLAQGYPNPRRYASGCIMLVGLLPGERKRQHRQKIVDLLEKWQAWEILRTRIGETPMALAFIRVFPIRVYTLFPGKVLEKM